MSKRDIVGEIAYRYALIYFALGALAGLLLLPLWLLLF